ncbi:SusC/RagA family TonB-linked outer membrane protein [Pedobacter nyackensis]|uniref:TonB-linked outer membrane protein, SusC/RagA family n=1 Tax=Pedobacter nyackensis TaxID=475255 RepID=A0A1W2B0G4_9SPHI|nr:SusC/RagA family TonB-linked outer membrane protein [Pedobacter nyackensis]SMC66426.1 TonB-linked outer membrane protein, SusC/RagA family [Pedobacter nyackensis]
MYKIYTKKTGMPLGYASKLLLIMRLTTVLLIATIMQVSASSLAQKITLSKKNAPLDQVINDIRDQSGYDFIYKLGLLKTGKPVTVNFKNADLQEVLNYCFKDQPFTYVLVDKTVIVRQNAASIKAIPSVQNIQSGQQRIIIEGKVIDAFGKDIAGATIRVSESNQFTKTDQQGRFRLESVASNAILIISYVGYNTQRVAVSSLRRPATIILTESLTRLQEATIISTGLQHLSKNVAVGSVSVATAKDLENSGITTFDKALAGKLPGVYVRSVTGRPGETGQIIIRGVNTLTGNVEPLYVLDGMPLQEGEVSGGMNALISNGIGNIPPENIESITILKDATAAAIYGSRAANGVIVITTKTGKAGSDYINYSGKFGITQKPENKFNFMNSQEKIGFERDLYNNYHMPYERSGRVGQLLNLVENGSMTLAEAEQKIALLGQTNTNWIDELYRNAFSQSHNISMSGGNTKTTYFTSLNYQNSQGSLIENKFQTAGFNMKLSRFITEKLLVNLNLYSTFKRNVEGQAGMDPFKYAVFANPYEKPYNDDGSYAADMTYRSIPYTVGTAPALLYTDFNILRELRENKLTNTYGNVRGQIAVEYSFLKGFKYTGNVSGSYTSVQDKDESYAGTYRSWANNWLNRSSSFSNVLSDYNRGFLEEKSGRTMDYTVRNTLEYMKKINKHFVQAFTAFEFGGILNDRFNHFNPIYLQEYAIAGYPNWDLVPDTRFMNLDLTRLGGTSTRENRNASYIGSLVYSYDNRYVFNGNLRYDGVDIIGSKNQFSPLWSAGVKWNAHNESFFEKYNSVISRLVLSMGYGYRGSINRTALPFHTYTLGTAVYNNIPTALNFAYGNPVIKWEKKQETNLGAEVSLFNGRINTEFRYFKEKVNDLLDNTVTPPSVGRPSAIVNIGTMSNKGFEISARVEALKTKDLLWELSGNITQVKNNLDNVYEKFEPNIATSATRNIQGYPVNGWFGYKYSHVDPETGSLMVQARKKKTALVGTEVVTSYTDELVDLSKITTALLQSDYATYYLGHRDPELYGGFSTRLVYKSLEFATTFVLATGNQIMGFRDRREGPSGNTDDLTASRTNRLKDNLNRWSQAGDITNIPLYRIGTSSYTQYLISTDLEKGNYLKCNEMSFSWRAPKSLLKQTTLKTLKATLVANNLFMVSNYSGTDPETQTAFGYPNTKAYTLSLTVGF